MEEIIQKVQALLATANCAGASDQERETAMRFAHKLLVKHNMSMESIDAASNPREAQDLESHGMVWARQIAKAVAELFFCKYYFSDVYRNDKTWLKKVNISSHKFVGKQSNAITAKELSNYLINSTFREGSRRMKAEDELKPYQWRMDFCKGVSNEIQNRAYEMRRDAQKENEAPAAQSATGTSIVLADYYKAEAEANNEFIKKTVGELVSVRGSQGISNADAFNSGSEFGRNLPLASGISDNRKTQLRLTK